MVAGAAATVSFPRVGLELQAHAGGLVQAVGAGLVRPVHAEPGPGEAPGMERGKGTVEQHAGDSAAAVRGQHTEIADPSATVCGPVRGLQDTDDRAVHPGHQPLLVRRAGRAG